MIISVSFSLIDRSLKPATLILPGSPFERLGANEEAIKNRRTLETRGSFFHKPAKSAKRAWRTSTDPDAATPPIDVRPSTSHHGPEFFPRLPRSRQWAIPFAQGAARTIVGSDFVIDVRGGELIG
jgi:hypothetical protein